MSTRPIFVLYPRGYRSGGPEAVHQLVHTLRGFGAEAFLVPEPGTETTPRSTVYEHYDAPEAPSVIDVAGNLVIAPETSLKLLRTYKRSTAVCWWLSIDNGTPFREHRRRYDFWSAQGALVEPPFAWHAKAAARHLALRARGDYRHLARIRHLAQSDYAKSYLYARANILATLVSDWTPLDGLVPGEHNRMTVTYNPAKARTAIASLKQRMPDVQFVALEGMNRDELINALQRSAVYLDLGFHPGKDRMPREAALCGAVSVVARRGAGAFFSDVPTPWEHKVSPEGDFVGNAERVLRSVLRDPRAAYQLQEPYRAVIRSEQQRFEDEVRVALLQERLDSLST